MAAAVLLLALLCQVRDRPAAASASGAISGRVTEELSGRPLPRTVLFLYKEDAAKSVEAVSDAEGRFAFTGLTAGKYGVLAAQDEHRSTYLRQWFGDSAPAERFGGAPRLSIELAAGEERTDVNFSLARALAIEGRVLDVWGDPMETAQVEATIVRTDGRPFPAASVFTDDLGTYRLYGLRPGRYHVCVTPAAQAAAPEGSTLERTCYPSSSGEGQDGREIVIASADVTGIEIQLQRGGSRSISGIVMDSRGTPVDAAEVIAFPSDSTAASRSGSTRDGAFTLKGLAPGRYMLRASVGVQPPGQLERPSREAELGFTTVDVGAVDGSGLVISLSKTTTVRGAVLFDGGSAPAVNATRMVVYASPADRGAWRLERAPISPVADDGSFQLTEVASLPAMIAVQWLPDGWALKSVRYGGRDITDSPTDFTTVAPNGRLEVVITNRVARPSIRVMDEQGAPHRDYRVVIIPADPQRRVRGPVLVPTQPSRDGVLALGTLLPSEYIVAALTVEDWGALIRRAPDVDAIAAIGTKVTFGLDDRGPIDLKLTRLPDKR